MMAAKERRERERWRAEAITSLPINCPSFRELCALLRQTRGWYVRIFALEFWAFLVAAQTRPHTTPRVRNIM